MLSAGLTNIPVEPLNRVLFVLISLTNKPSEKVIFLSSLFLCLIIDSVVCIVLGEGGLGVTVLVERLFSAIMATKLNNDSCKSIYSMRVQANT